MSLARVFSRAQCGLEALPEPLKDPGGGLPTLYDLPQVGLIDNWSAIEAIPDVIVQNEQGEDVNVGHYAWVEGPGGGGARQLRTIP